MKPKRLDHVVFAVRDLAEAEVAWKSILGLEVGERLQPDVIQSSLGLISPGRDSAMLELAQPAGAEGPVARVLDERGEGMLSISIEVDDVAACVDELQAAGVAISDVVDGPLQKTRVARMAPDAAHGVSLQLIQRL